MKEKLKSAALVAGAILASLALAPVLAYNYYKNNPKLPDGYIMLTITHVGGCDMTGACGVMLDNGRYAVLPHPVVGAKIVVPANSDQE